MAKSFGETVRRLRIESGLSQQQLADRLHVGRPSVANWEVGRRMPDVATVALIAETLGVDTAALLAAAEESDGAPNVLLVDDSPIVLKGGLPILRQALPGANVVGFTKRQEAVEYFKQNPVALAFLDIEMGRVSGLDVCRELLQVNPRTNVIYLTAYREYSFDAWATGACGYLLKPITVDAVRKILASLRYPIRRDGGV